MLTETKLLGLIAQARQQQEARTPKLLYPGSTLEGDAADRHFSRVSKADVTSVAAQIKARVLELKAHQEGKKGGHPEYIGRTSTDAKDG